MNATALNYYDFFWKTGQGYCWNIWLPTWGWEPFSALLCIPGFILGIAVALFKPNTMLVYRITYAMISAYNVAAGVYHITLYNGNYRIMDVVLSYLQSTVLILLGLALYERYLANKQPKSGCLSVLARCFSGILILIFVFYPGLVHVLGESFSSGFIAFVVFDALWLIIALELFVIMAVSAQWPGVQQRPVIQMSVLAGLGVILAYAFWCVDYYLCSFSIIIAYVQLHGLWTVTLSVAFYHFVALAEALSCARYGAEANMTGLFGGKFYIVGRTNMDPQVQVIEEKDEGDGFHMPHHPQPTRSTHSGSAPRDIPMNTWTADA